LAVVSDLKSAGLSARLEIADTIGALGSQAEGMRMFLTWNAETTRKDMTAYYDFLDEQAGKPLCEWSPAVDAYMKGPGAQWDGVTKFLCPVAVGARVNSGREETHIAALRIAIALERFRLAKNSYPKALAELAPAFIDALPPDPFSGKPFGYRIEDDGSFTLWSVGEDLKDDDGQGNPEKPWNGPDYLFTGGEAKRAP
jgi:hypothetical protein